LAARSHPARRLDHRQQARVSHRIRRVRAARVRADAVEEGSPVDDDELHGMPLAAFKAAAA
jgi:hypothetical protein